MSPEQQSIRCRKVAIGVNTVGFNGQIEPPLEIEPSGKGDVVNLQSKRGISERISAGCCKLLPSPEWCMYYSTRMWKLTTSEYSTRLYNGLGSNIMFISESLSFISISLMLRAVLSPRFLTVYKSSENPNDKSCYMYLGLNIWFTICTAFLWYFYGTSPRYLITKIIETLVLCVISAIFYKKTITN